MTEARKIDAPTRIGPGEDLVLSPDREAFERYFAGSRKSKGAGRKPTFARLQDGTYADDHTQRHWWTWQNASSARNAMPTEPCRARHAKGVQALDGVGDDEFGRVVLNDGVYSDALQCRWRSWRVVGPRALAVDLPPVNCADMDGASRVAEVLLPGVREIHAFCDGAPAAMYSCVGGRWQAFKE
jgi:hypothetical protein